jgi:hypothetical protein
MKRRVWTAYAAIVSTVTVIGEVGAVLRTGEIDARTFANWFVVTVLLIGTWCYALGKPLATERYWRLAFWLVLFASVVTSIPALLSGPEARLIVAVSALLIAPAFVAMYRYGHRSPALWSAPDGSR